MSDLNKLLVHVPSSLCDDFRAKYIVDGANRDKSYDNKVVFLVFFYFGDKFIGNFWMFF